MEAKVGVFGRGMASVKIQYFADGRQYGMFKARASQHGGAFRAGLQAADNVAMLCMPLSSYHQGAACVACLHAADAAGLLDNRPPWCSVC